MGDRDLENRQIVVPVPPTQFDEPQIMIQDAHVDSLIRVIPARRQFDVSGKGLTVAVLDSGLRTTHQDFEGRLVAQRNFTSDHGGDPNNVTDGLGHGTHVTGIIAGGKGARTGIAHDAGIVALKVLTKLGGSFAAVQQGLRWVLDNHQQHNITVVSMSLGDSTNDSDDAPHQDSALLDVIRKLADRRIPVVVAAGNDYFRHQREGMAFPAILRETISVGAVYDAVMGEFSYESGAMAFESKPDVLTPFSQRLSEATHPQARTDIFAPGAPVLSAGINNDQAESIQSGTSQAAPVISGVVLLMQEFYKRTTGHLPSIDELEQCLRRGAVPIQDLSGARDNVRHTDQSYLRVDALSALGAVHRILKKDLLQSTTPYSLQRTQTR